MALKPEDRVHSTIFTLSIMLTRTGVGPNLRLPSVVYPAFGGAFRRFSVLNRPPPQYHGHVPLTFTERGVLAVGSALTSLLNPRRGGTVKTVPHQ